jgi:hypothetical protein
MFGEVIKYRFNFFNGYRLIQVICFYLHESQQILFQGIGPLQWNVSVGTELLMIPLYYSSNIIGICTDDPLSTLILVICVISFFFLTKYTITDSINCFKELAFWFIDFLHWLPIFSFTDFCYNYFISSNYFGFNWFFCWIP